MCPLEMLRSQTVQLNEDDKFSVRFALNFPLNPMKVASLGQGSNSRVHKAICIQKLNTNTAPNFVQLSVEIFHNLVSVGLFAETNTSSYAPVCGYGSSNCLAATR